MSVTDDISLSCYLDGELDYTRATEITNQINQNEETRDRFVAMAESQCLLRAYGQTEAGKNIPPKLIQALRNKNKQKRYFIKKRTIFQVAAVVLLFISSYFMGQQTRTGQLSQPSLVPVIPASLGPTINTVLEYQKSGSSPDWIQIQNGISARVTPVRSFRGSDGTFYRMYLIDMSDEGGTQQFWAMASRLSKENWQTKGVFTNGAPGII
jgi:hypothetical protein